MTRQAFESNWKAPLTRLAKCSPPCVPYLGMFLNHICKLEESMADEYTPPTRPRAASSNASSVAHSSISFTTADIPSFATTSASATSSTSSASVGASASSAAPPSFSAHLPPPPLRGNTAPAIAQSAPPSPSREHSTLINFSKRRKIAEVIAKIQTYQNGEYSLPQVPEVKDYLHRRMAAWEAALLQDMLRGTSSRSETPCGKSLDDAMHALSLKLEPRRGSVAGGALESPRGAPASPRRGSMPAPDISRPSAAGSPTSRKSTRRGSY